MKNFKLVLIIGGFILFCHAITAQDPLGTWKAKWISHPTADLTKFGVYNFRRTFTLVDKPGSFIIHVSADNRYRLFVNGTPVAFGPARGDLSHWRYETIDIANYLIAGNNIIAAVVHNEAADRPQAQITSKTAFILMADTSDEQLVNTGTATWKVIKNTGYTQITNNDLAWWNWAHGWYAIGATDKVTGSNFPWGWESLGFDDSNWLTPKILTSSDNIEWVLEPRQIPMLEETFERFPKIARATGVTATIGFIQGTSSLAIPPNSTVSVLIDMTYETIGYPELTVSQGNNSNIKLTYAEALFKGSQKGNRNDVTGKTISGYWDIFIPDGGNNRLFRPLWMRTFRYLQLDITTSTDTLVINDLHNVFTAYPFEREASFSTSDTSLTKIWDVSWHTLRLCATETNFDCPYYEQLNYEGDTRIQSMIALYTSGDDRLMRDAIRQFNNSFRSNRDLTQGAYPYILTPPDNFILPVYSLYFIGIVHDYFMNRKDDEFIKLYIPSIKKILEDFHKRIDGTKMLGARLNQKDWNFVDWCFNNGTPDGGDTGNSSLLSLEYLKAIQEAIKLFNYYGYQSDVTLWQGRATELKNAVNSLCYDDSKNIYSETPAKNSYSQHTNILAILTDAVDVSLQKDLMNQILIGTNMTHCTLYYKYYLFRALNKTGLSDKYLTLLDTWRSMLSNGLSTFAEMENINTTRSDCHAWSASPAYDFLSSIAGIEPAEPGFKTVKIEPSFGTLTAIHAQMPHPAGFIKVDLNKNGNDSVYGTIILPVGLTGNFYYKGSVIVLEEGSNIIRAVTSSISSNESSKEEYIAIFPNPALDILNISMKGNYSNPELFIYDESGRLILQNKLQKANSEVSITALPVGNYICNIIANGKVIKKSIFIKK